MHYKQKREGFPKFQALKYEKSPNSENGIEKDYRDRARIKAYNYASLRPRGAKEQPIALAKRLAQRLAGAQAWGLDIAIRSRLATVI
jgi:hypothetical protein